MELEYLRMKSLVGHLRFAIAFLWLSVLLAVFEYPMLIRRDVYTSFISPFSPWRFDKKDICQMFETAFTIFPNNSKLRFVFSIFFTLFGFEMKRGHAVTRVWYITSWFGVCKVQLVSENTLET